MKDVQKRTVYNIGFRGEGPYEITKSGERTKASAIWKGMLQRCYRRLGGSKSYEGVTVCEEWHNFQNFAKWFYEHYQEGFDLDKDILVKGNKVYGPETCCIVPKPINYLFMKCDKKRGDYPIGVSLVHNRFQVTLRKYGKTFNIGRYTTIEEAFNRYKECKEDYIKEMADKWKEVLSDRVYQAMYNYKVEITD